MSVVWRIKRIQGSLKSRSKKRPRALTPFRRQKEKKQRRKKIDRGLSPSQLRRETVAEVFTFPRKRARGRRKKLPGLCHPWGRKNSRRFIESSSESCREKRGRIHASGDGLPRAGCMDGMGNLKRKRVENQSNEPLFLAASSKRKKSDSPGRDGR